MISRSILRGREREGRKGKSRSALAFSFRRDLSVFLSGPYPTIIATICSWREMILPLRLLPKCFQKPDVFWPLRPSPPYCFVQSAVFAINLLRFIIFHPHIPQPRNGGWGTKYVKTALKWKTPPRTHTTWRICGVQNGEGKPGRGWGGWGRAGRRWFHQLVLTRTGQGSLIPISGLSNPYSCTPYVYRYRDHPTLSDGRMRRGGGGGGYQSSKMFTPRCLFDCANRFNQTSFVII